MPIPAWQNATLDTYFDIQCRRREVRQHRKRVRKMKSDVDNKPPKKLPHLSNATSKQSFSDFEYKRIDMENSKLLERLHDLSTEPSQYRTHAPVGSKNVGGMLRRRERERIGKENERLARRIRSVKPTYKKKEWDRHARRHGAQMEERMKRHLVRTHGPRFARKIEERKYCGKHRSFSDIGSEVSFDTMTETSEATSFSKSSFTSSFETASISESIVESARSSQSKRSIQSIKQNKSQKKKRAKRKQSTRYDPEEDDIQETCFSLENLDAFINPNIPEISMRPVTKTAEDETSDIPDWEDDQEWQEQEMLNKKSGKNHRVIQLQGVEL